MSSLKAKPTGCARNLSKKKRKKKRGGFLFFFKNEEVEKLKGMAFP